MKMPPVNSKGNRNSRTVMIYFQYISDLQLILTTMRSLI